MRLKTRLLATVFAISMPYTASAQMLGLSHGYVGLAGDWVLPMDSSIKDGFDLKAEHKDGWGAIGTIGGRMNNGIRGELELGYRENDIDSIRGVGVPGGLAAGSGDVHAWTIMVNGLYDFVNSTRFTPYLGVGIGAANIDYGTVGPIGLGGIDDDTWTFAYQGIAGVSYRIADNFSVFANYQYLGTPKFDMDTVGTGAGTGSVETEYNTNNFLLGISYLFGTQKAVAQPAPEPAPAPEPQPQVEQAPVTPNSYLVFFDWNKATLTEEGRQVVRTAADNAKSANATHIDVTGHADRSGSSAYNMALSKRRAETVRNELIRLGVAANEISIAARGEEDPLVATDDGVREPQNRRVEILYSAQ
jgi:OmpA-OmpF porin, OOP family